MILYPIFSLTYSRKVGLYSPAILYEVFIDTLGVCCLIPLEHLQMRRLLICPGSMYSGIPLAIVTPSYFLTQANWLSITVQGMGTGLKYWKSDMDLDRWRTRKIFCHCNSFRNIFSLFLIV